MKRFLPPLAASLALITLDTACKPKPVVIPTQPAADAPSDRSSKTADAADAPAAQPAPEAQDRPAAVASTGGNRRQGDGDRGNRQNRDGGGQGGNFEQRRQEMMQRMKTEIGLSDEQVQQIQAVFQNGGQMSREQRRAEIQKILTPEQQQKWEAMREQWRQRRSGGEGGQRRQGGGNN